MKKSIVKMDSESPEISQNEGADILVKRFNDKLEHEETSAILKIIWSYMVFTTATTEPRQEALENELLWEKLVTLLQSKVIPSYLIYSLMTSLIKVLRDISDQSISITSIKSTASSSLSWVTVIRSLSRFLIPSGFRNFSCSKPLRTSFKNTSTLFQR